MRESSEFKTSVDWYYANLDSLLPKYHDRFVAVANGAFFGDYGTCIDGVRALERAGHPRGTFIVHKCIPIEQEKREWYYLTNP